MSVSSPPFTSHFATLSPHYDVVFSDVWGVVHNGVLASPEACEALANFRRQGGTVILITNAPRPGEVVVHTMLDRLQVPHAAYDGIISSGDVTRALIAARGDQRVLHIGPARDLPIFEGLAARVSPIESADYAVCSGLTDDTVETPDDYRDLIAQMRARSLPMICANPDIVVERGDALVYCAGAIADRYADAGGDVTYAGKPYRPIYEQALAIAQSARGAPTDPKRVLAIGEFGAHRSQRRGSLRHRLPVRHRWHSRRRARGARQSRRCGSPRHLHQGRRLSQSGDAATRLVTVNDDRALCAPAGRRTNPRQGVFVENRSRTCDERGRMTVSINPLQVLRAHRPRP